MHPGPGLVLHLYWTKPSKEPFALQSQLQEAITCQLSMR